MRVRHPRRLRGARSSRLDLTLGGRTISVPMFLHIDSGLPSSGSVTHSEQGQFTFSKFGLGIFA